MSILQSISKELRNCNHCMQKCSVDRTKGNYGFCNVGKEPLVASICLHRGEEPAISGKEGVCNVFFAHCNLACVYCQNHQISRNDSPEIDGFKSYDSIVEKIICILDQGTNRLGFVSPTHQVLQMVEILERVKDKGYKPVVIYNTNAFDSPTLLRQIESLVDIYLPDIKYFSNDLALAYSNAKNYSYHAINALKEMIWQKGTSLLLDDHGYALSGVIVRHLILPGHTDDSIKVLEAIANNVSTDLNMSIMSQYYPSGDVSGYNNLSRIISQSEYDVVLKEFDKLGFYRGWFQQLESSNYYRPNFSQRKPFK